jgi:bifunctional enzyme Fae/Hps
VAPKETLDEFVSACRVNNLDAMIDMMNVESSIAVLKKLNNLPEVVVLHRGVDETEKSQGKMIPFYQINQIKGNYNLLVAVAGGDTSQEIQSAVFNGADIVVVWKDFMAGGGVRAIAESFLKEIK